MEISANKMTAIVFSDMQMPKDMSFYEGTPLNAVA
jgi:hypothetical protein